MARFGISVIAVTIILATVSLQQSLAIQCWKCTNLLHKHCDDPFDGDKLIQANGPQHFMQCQTKCMKVKAHDPISRISIVLRGCVDYIDQFKKKCVNILAGSKIDFCEYCTTDGCNEASQFGSAAFLVVIPIVIAHILLA